VPQQSRSFGIGDATFDCKSVFSFGIVLQFSAQMVIVEIAWTVRWQKKFFQPANFPQLQLMKMYALALALLIAVQPIVAQKDSIPNTGIGGVYEVMVGTNNAAYHIQYFGEFGFRVVDSATLTAAQATAIYGVPSALKAYRLQNGEIDSHGLLRLLAWEKPLGNGVGYGMPETIGQRMSVLLTSDIVRLYDVYTMLRNKQEKWLPTEPIADDLFGLNKADSNNFFKRPILVRENCVYGDFFNHVFFQRYGYTINGYGTINKNAPLKTSEFTHHDFVIQVDSIQQLMYLQTAFGLKAEKAPTIDGDWQRGPRATFAMEQGYSHWYQGFVSPNNICGKLKFFLPMAPKPNRTQNQRPGELGITLHSFTVPDINYVYSLVKRHGLKPTAIAKNEFGETSFVVRGPEGASWQLIEKKKTQNQPVTQLKFTFTKD
jgi:hypothetical protein